MVNIGRRHVREFREAAQQVPKQRTGKLRSAMLPQLVEWSRKHPETDKIANSTINKWLTCLQSVLNWARENGMISDEVAWADPVSNMRLGEARSKRQPWEPQELCTLFRFPIYTNGERPLRGKGEAAFWLPLLGLFSGARLSELAPLCANDVQTDRETSVTFITVIDDPETGRSLETKGSLRVIPLHSELLRIGFLDFVESRRMEHGAAARLFAQ